MRAILVACNEDCHVQDQTPYKHNTACFLRKNLPCYTAIVPIKDPDLIALIPTYISTHPVHTNPRRKALI